MKNSVHLKKRKTEQLDQLNDPFNKFSDKLIDCNGFVPRAVLKE